MAKIQVPRVTEITGKKTVEEQRAEREWRNARKYITTTHKYGTPEAKLVWQRRIEQTRSF